MGTFVIPMSGLGNNKKAMEVGKWILGGKDKAVVLFPINVTYFVLDFIQ